nr:DNA circularization N-terminal domain-containing protein [Crenobacter caeni]
MRDASFKGHPIKWLSQEGQAGRRLAEHEFPQRDRPWVEDMGRMVRPFTFTAVCSGDGWLEELNQLLAVIESPGSGELVHPLFGRMTVSARPARWAMSLDAGGRVDVQLEFVETGDLLFPVPLKETVSQVRAARAELLGHSQSLLEKAMGFVSDGRVKADAVMGLVDGHVRSVVGVADGIRSVFGGVQQMVAEVLSSPVTGIAKLLRVFELSRQQFQGQSDLTKWGARQAQVIRQLRSRSSAVLGRSNQSSAGRVAGVLLKTMTVAATMSAADALSELPARRVGRGDAPVAEDIRAVRNAMQAALWDMASDETRFCATPAIGALPLSTVSALQPLSHAAGQSYLELARALGAHLAAVESVSLRLETITPATVLPALVLAYQEHGNAMLADEMVSRNAIRHPLFVPIQPLQVAHE